MREWNRRETVTVKIGYGEITSHAISMALLEAEAHGDLTLLQRMRILERMEHFMVQLFRGEASTVQPDGTTLRSVVEQKEPTNGH